MGTKPPRTPFPKAVRMTPAPCPRRADPLDDRIAGVVSSRVPVLSPLPTSKCAAVSKASAVKAAVIATPKPTTVATRAMAANVAPSGQIFPNAVGAAGPGGGSVLRDNELRMIDFKRVVVNFANVAAHYGDRVLKRNGRIFDYDGVRRCVQYLKGKLGLLVVGVVFENFRMYDQNGKEVWEVPADISAMCETVEMAPRLAGLKHKSADDEMTIKCAYRRNCRFLDNDNYSDWKQRMRDERIRAWLEHCQDLLQMRFYFDTGLGCFETLDGNIPEDQLSQGPSQPAMKRLRSGVAASSW